jgi:hypothetical protein
MHLNNVEARWDIHLFCCCPKCYQDVDLLEYVDFWDGRSFEIGEHDTRRSRNVDVIRPLCDEEFEIDLTY